jgi:hypothetical protein
MLTNLADQLDQLPLDIENNTDQPKKVEPKSSGEI